MPFPLAKLVALGLRQTSRHVAAFVKIKAKENERFRKVLVKSAGWYHRIQMQSKLNILGLGKAKHIEPLSEQAAIDLGVELLGDVVMVTCALGIYLTVETWSSRSKEHEEKIKLKEMTLLKETVADQCEQIEKLAARLGKLEKIFEGTTLYSQTSEKVLGELSRGKDVLKDKT